MDFSALIIEYKERDSTASPIWIYYEKRPDNTAKCNLCQASVPRKDGSTTGMVIHLKRHHGFLKKHNAYKTYEELSVLKDNRLKAKKRSKIARVDGKQSKPLSIHLNHVSWS